MSKAKILEISASGEILRDETDEELASRQERAHVREEMIQQRQNTKQRRQQHLQRLEVIRDEIATVSADPADMNKTGQAVQQLAKVIELLQLEIAHQREPDIADFP